MNVRIFIEPGERADAMEAYGDWLTPDQIDTIMDAPESACNVYATIGGTHG